MSMTMQIDCEVPICCPSQTMKVNMLIMIIETMKIETIEVIGFLVVIMSTMNAKDMAIPMP